MASDVDICNLALGRLGDDATVTNIDPPDDSAQASHCSRFYPIARDTLQDMFPWNFCMQRIQLAQGANLTTEWSYAYAAPTNALDIIAVYDPAAPDDINFGIPQAYNNDQAYTSTATTQASYVTGAGLGVLTPQNFVVEADANGNSIIYSNQPNAVAHIATLVTDTTKFPPLFTDALSWLLASYLAGPVLKGDAGVSAGNACWRTFQTMFGKATSSDAAQRRQQPNQQVITPWMVNR